MTDGAVQDVMMFFLTDESGVRRDVAKRFLHHLRNLLRHFETANNRYATPHRQAAARRTPCL